MPVRRYSELHPDQQGQVLSKIMGGPKGDRSALHQALEQSDFCMVIVDAYNGVLTAQALPCAYGTYLREQMEINTGRYAA